MGVRKRGRVRDGGKEGRKEKERGNTRKKDRQTKLMNGESEYEVMYNHL